jgi:hypothetical protein
MTRVTGNPVLFPHREVLRTALEGRSEAVQRDLCDELFRRVLARALAGDPGVVVWRYTAGFDEVSAPVGEAVAAGWVRWTAGPDGPQFPLVQADEAPGTSFVLMCPEAVVTDLIAVIAGLPEWSPGRESDPLARTPRE